MTDSTLKSLLVALLLVALGHAAKAQPAGYGYGVRLLIQGSQISGGSSLSNFPVLVSITLPELKTTGNGGNVRNASGFDITFT
ncbi:MAG TPA: hypothetical protein PK760_05485, partial [Flavobacteriales bacterium]|nr:hypothetical protein [Flavobacteriales bacterium]